MSRPGAIDPAKDVDGANPVSLGDVDGGVEQVAGALSPVPGGVGPVTTALLLRHVSEAAARLG